MIWYGDEVGMWGSDDPFCRKPMLWADLPPNDDPEERIRAGHLDAYRALIALRRESEVLRRGTFKTLVADDARNLWIFERALGNERVIVALNGSTEAQAMPEGIPDPVPGTCRLVHGTSRHVPDTPRPSIPALGGLIFRPKSAP
jgi:glycosidase